jgi:hypothetical protein
MRTKPRSSRRRENKKKERERREREREREERIEILAEFLPSSRIWEFE